MNLLNDKISREVAGILLRVKKDGDAALQYYAKKFDGIRLHSKQFLVSKKSIRESFRKTEPSVRSALLTAKRRIESFHRLELRKVTRNWTASLDGIRIGQNAHPVSSVGIYVPGGRASYPSTVLMTAIPARVAGVKKIVMVTPNKNLKDETLAAADLCAIDHVFCVGGPSAIAALAYGTRTIPQVEKIVGPGNQYVTEAKRQVYGKVGIDGLAGPSEIAVWADASASPSTVAVNLCAQAEHDPQSKSFLLTTAKKVCNNIRKEIPRPFLRQVTFMVLKNPDEVVERINKIAPEHLYLAVRSPRSKVPKILNAGAVFVGEKTPVALGDYSAGPSHVLPTGGSARFSSGLSVKDFIKWSSVIENTSLKSSRVFDAARTLSEVEGFDYHALSLTQ